MSQSTGVNELKLRCNEITTETGKGEFKRVKIISRAGGKEQ